MRTVKQQAVDSGTECQGPSEESEKCDESFCRPSGNMRVLGIIRSLAQIPLKTCQVPKM